MKKQIVVVLSILLLTSCATRDQVVYFRNIEKLDDMEAIEQFQPRIEVNDVLRIQISSLNEEVVQPFRLGNDRQSGGGTNNQSLLNGYLVDATGNIKFPVLGRIEVLGMTRGELEDYLTGELQEYVTDVVVRVRIMNFSVTVMGEIGSSVITVQDERLTIPQAIAMAGDITYNGKRENILVIRDHNGKKSYGRVDITDADVFQNPYYFLKQNDIVYVEPTYRQVKSAGFITSWQGLVSIVTTAFSLYVIFNN